MMLADEQIMALWREVCNSNTKQPVAIAFARALADKDALRDAERYRYMRDNDLGLLYGVHLNHMQNDVQRGYEPAALDIAVDAMIARSSPTKGERNG